MLIFSFLRIMDKQISRLLDLVLLDASRSNFSRPEAVQFGFIGA